MTSQAKILLIIAAFLFVVIGSFILFVASWDPNKEEPVSQLASPEVLI